jgi:wyosine [tRNA(Phe)-imidazoG37] synthetase (radical SAM superfamily)
MSNNNINRISELQNQIKTSRIEIAWIMSVGDSGSSDYDNEFSKLRSAQDELDSIAA